MAQELRHDCGYRLDRLTRSGIRDTLDVVDELRRAGVELITISDGFALNGPAAEVILAVMAWAAKMERLAINERIATARARLEAEGRPWGRPKRLTPVQVQTIRADRAAGRMIREIAQARKVPKSTGESARRDLTPAGGACSPCSLSPSPSRWPWATVAVAGRNRAHDVSVPRLD